MKNLINYGKALTKAEQKSINGGNNECPGPPTYGFCCTRCAIQDPCLICVN